MNEIASPQPDWRRYAGLRSGVFLSLLFLLLGFFSVVWTPYPVEALNVGAAMQDGSAAHWFGTDTLGRDVLSLVMKGILTSFVVAGVAVVIGALVGLPLGLAAATWRGPFDWLARGIIDYFSLLPALLLAILFATAFAPSALGIMAVIGIANVAAFTRAMRNGWQAESRPAYIVSARLAGLAGWDLVRRHMLANLVPLLVATALAQLSAGILAEAALSYLGLGVQSPATSLGLILREAQSYALLRPALMLIPGLVVVALALALRLVARGVHHPVPHTAGASRDPA